MSTIALISRLRRKLRAFRTANRGNVVITFALATVPMVGFVGTAVDYSRANSAKAALQGAVNSTALMLSKEAQTLTTAQLQQKAKDYFNALFNRTDVTDVAITPVFTTPQQSSFRLDVAGSGKVATTFTKVFGQQTLTIDATSQVLWGMKKLELALALDNTGSMASSNKMTELKKAAHSLLDTLKKAAKKDGDIKVAIIPFDTTVRAGAIYKNESWVDFQENKIKQKDWEGCLMDRDQPNDVLDTPPSSEATKFPAADCGSLAQLLPLTSDWTALNAKIDQMTPSGYTNVTIGLVWGWHALTANQPLPHGSAPSPDLDKVIILLTDGENTKNRWTSSPSAIDARTAQVCANVKAANIKLYTVRVIEGNASLLKACASNPNMYFDVQQASQLNKVFSAIAQNLANLRIAK